MLAATVREAARRFPDRTCVVDPSGWGLTYGQLDQVSDEVAAWLARDGFVAGQVAAIVLPPSVEWLALYVGCAKAGATVAGVSTRLTPEERERVLARAEPDLTFGTAELLKLSGPGTVEVRLAGAADGTADELLTDLRAPGLTAAAALDSPQAAACIAFTSGTTGLPKGAVFGVAELAAITAMDVGDGWGGGHAALLSTHPAHVGFLTKLPGHLRSGTRLHLLPHWRAADALRTICEQRIPVIGGVGAQIALLLRLPDLERYELSHVRQLVAGGGPSPAALILEAERVFGADYSVRYSSTESGGLGTLTRAWDPESERLESVGHPRPGVLLEVRDEHGHQVPAGEIGEVHLRSPAVMRGYWHDPEATAAAMVDGWLRTGDLGELSASGALRLAGRRDAMYVRGGYNVHPQEVEAALLAAADVAAVAVVPRPDPVLGSIGVAVVVPTDPTRPPTLEELRAHLADRLAPYKLPQALRVVPALPLTPGDKVDRRALIAHECAP